MGTCAAMRCSLAIACVIVAFLSAEGADDSSTAKPVGHYIGTGASTGESKDVSSVIPQFQTGKQWHAANEKLKAGYNRANTLYKKLNAKAYKAQGEKSKELNSKADKALMKLKDAKERIQKKYANDDPADFGEGHLTSADKANKKLDAAAANTDEGTWGSSGTPRQMKWYTDGVISSNARTDEDGHYLLGASRRRIGAGFGRRRRFVDPTKKVTKHEVKKAEKGHEMLKAMGKPGSASSTDTDDIIKGMDKHTSAAFKAMRAATAEKKKEEKKEKKKLPPGDAQADKKTISEADAAALKATGAGEDAVVDKTAHFTDDTDVKIVGKEETNVITGGESTAAAEAKTEGKTEEDEFTEDEVIELIQETLQ